MKNYWCLLSCLKCIECVFHEDKTKSHVECEQNILAPLVALLTPRPQTFCTQLDYTLDAHQL